ncbi:hypothetical protein D4Q76_02255, partial [archaeon]
MSGTDASLEDVILVLLNENLGNNYEKFDFGKFQELMHKYKDKSPLLKDILFDTNSGQPQSKEIGEALGTLRTCGLLEVSATDGYMINGAELY